MTRRLLSAFAAVLAIAATTLRCTGGDPDVTRGGLETTGGVFATLEYPDLVLQGPAGLRVGIYDTSYLALTTTLFSDSEMLDAEGNGRLANLDDGSYSLYCFDSTTNTVAYARRIVIDPDSAYTRELPLTAPATLRRSIFAASSGQYDTLAAFIPGTPLFALPDANDVYIIQRVPQGEIPFAVGGLTRGATGAQFSLTDVIHEEALSVEAGETVNDTVSLSNP